MNSTDNKNYYEVLLSKNSDLSQYLDLAPSLKFPKANSTKANLSANGKSPTPTPHSFRRLLPNS